MDQRTDSFHVREQFLRQVSELLRRRRLEAERASDDDRPSRERIEELIEAGDREALQRALDRLQPADVAYIL